MTSAVFMLFLVGHLSKQTMEIFYVNKRHISNILWHDFTNYDHFDQSNQSIWTSDEL